MSQDFFSSSQLSQEPVVGGDDGSGHNSDSEKEETEPPFSQMSDLSLKKNGSKHKLLHTDLPKEVISKHKQVFAQIQKKTKEAEDLSDILRSTKVLSEQIHRQDKYYKSGGVNDNMTLDAKCISTNTGISYQLVKRLQTDSKLFDPMEFAEKLLTAVNPFHRIDETVDENESIRVDTNDWVEFGRTYCRFHKLLPTLNFINGSFDSTVGSTQQKQTKTRVKHQKPILSAQTEATQIDPNSKTTDDSTPQEVEHILKTVKKLESKNPSLPYIDIIVNPNSIAQTVENIFHSAFLVKDGLARLTPDEDDGLPIIASIDNSNIDLSQPERGVQSVFSFSMSDWKSWVQKFEITKPAIKHLKKSSDKK